MAHPGYAMHMKHTALSHLFRRLLAPLALGAVALVLSACNPQNATPPQVLSRVAGASASVVAVDVQRNNGARHLLAAECLPATCRINYTRRPAGAGAPLLATVALTTSRYVDEMAVAALNDGGAVAVWLESLDNVASPYRYRYSVISSAGAASPPADLDAAGATVSARGQHRMIGLHSNGTRAVAVFEGVVAGSERIYYRQLAPAVTDKGLVFDQASMGGPGRVENASIVVAPGGEAHMTWRQVRTGSGPGTGDQIGYAIGATSGSPDVPAAGRFVLSEPGVGVGFPELAVDIVPTTPRVWVAYNATTASFSHMRAVQVNAGAPVVTRTLDFAGRDYQNVLGNRLSLAFNSSEPLVGFLIDNRGDSIITKDFAIWRTKDGSVTRQTYSGRVSNHKAANL